MIEPEPTRDHTERMLRALRRRGRRREQADGGRAHHARRPAELTGALVRVPGDPSSAAFPLVAALIVPGSEVTVENVGLNPLRTGLFETLREMGADLTVDERARARRASRSATSRVARSAR